MKKLCFSVSLLLMAGQLLAQQNAVTLSGGYAFANIEAADAQGTGWRINGSYEYQPLASKMVHGLSIGYINTTAEEVGSEYTIGSFPIYYAPKYLIGDGSLNGFVKAAVGFQFSSLKRTGALSELETNDSGFYGGLGAGVIKTFNEKVFLNLEYEWAYLSNSYYRDGFMNSIMLGIGMKL